MFTDIGILITYNIHRRHGQQFHFLHDETATTNIIAVKDTRMETVDGRKKRNLL